MENPITVQAVLEFFQMSMLSTFVASQQSSAAITSLPAMTLKKCFLTVGSAEQLNALQNRLDQKVKF